MKYLKLTSLFIVVLLVSCNKEQTLQEYYIESANNPNFISVDIPANLLQLDESTLNEEQKQAYQSLKKFNVLAYRIKDENKMHFETEKNKIHQILKADTYSELMKIKDKGRKGVIKYLGTEEAIDEVIIFGNDEKFGFALVRVLGDNMKPHNIMQLIKVLEKNDFNSKELKKIGEIFKN